MIVDGEEYEVTFQRAYSHTYIGENDDDLGKVELLIIDDKVYDPEIFEKINDDYNDLLEISDVCRAE